MIEAPPNTSAPQRSADGLWEWNGTKWTATQSPPGPQQAAQSAPIGQHLPQVPVKKKGHLIRNVGIVIGALLLIGIGAAIASSGSAESKTTSGASDAFSSPAATAQATAQATTQPTSKPTSKPTAAPTAPTGPTLTNQQQNAVKSAQSYLSFTAFSRQGLIDQLSSAYGDKYAVKDATIAVDSLHVDWNAEAVQSAKSYLSFSAFSCQGLIDQLDSAYGEKFTVAQATYGAKQAGAC